MKITIVSETALGPKTDEHTIPQAAMQRIEITLENNVTLRFEEFTDHWCALGMPLGVRAGPVDLIAIRRREMRSVALASSANPVHECKLTRSYRF